MVEYPGPDGYTRKQLAGKMKLVKPEDYDVEL
jgi:hypothetical protein